MEHPYPREFPETSRRRVRTEEILAGRAFEEGKKEAHYYSDLEPLLRTFILRVFLAFVREASVLVHQGIWSIEKLESESLEFLRTFTISAWYERGYRRDGSRLRKMVSDWGGSLLERVERAFRKSPLWKEYEDILLGVACVGVAGTPVECEPSAAPISKQPKASVTWQDIEVTFISDERVQIRVGLKQSYTLNYAEMGFEDRRTGKPNQAWGMLRALAQADGIVPNSSRDSKDFAGMCKRFERLRHSLKAYFQIDSDPIPLDSTTGYCCQFKITCAPAFAK